MGAPTLVDALEKNGAALPALESRRSREVWEALCARRDEPGVEFLEQRRARDFCRRYAATSVTCWDENSTRVTRATLGTLLAVLESAEIHPEGMFHAVADDDSFVLVAQRGQGRLKVAIQLMG